MSKETPRVSRARMLIVTALVLVAGVALVRLADHVDWSAVGAAIGKLSWWQLPVLVAGLLLRQVLNASPLAFYIEGLGVRRAVLNDQTAILMSTVAPPPTDVVMRVAMFTSWGISASAGIAGALMNTITFYLVRFAAPTAGLLLLLGVERFEPTEVVFGAVCLLISLALLAALWFATRGSASAALLGRTAGRLVRRVRSSVDPERWATSASEFLDHVADRLPRALPRSLLALTAMVICDAGLVLLSLRFVGLTTGEVSAGEVLVAFLLAYPLTLFPLSGLGILDAAVIGSLVAVAGSAVEPELVAGLIVWRVTTLLTPLLLGAAALTWWKWQRVHPAQVSG